VVDIPQAGSPAAGGLAIRSRRCAGGPPLTVSILGATGYQDQLADNVRRIPAEHKATATGKRLVLKPNLDEFDRGTSINTNPSLALAACESISKVRTRLASTPEFDSIRLAGA
jgi:uncharacterized protein (DUF362 family)